MEDLLNIPVGQQFVSPKSGITLTVNGGSFGQVPVESVLSGEAKRIEMRASADGQRIVQGWHDGTESDQQVWAEIWTIDIDGPVCVFHGTVDSQSRRITQVG